MTKPYKGMRWSKVKAIMIERLRKQGGYGYDYDNMTCYYKNPENGNKCAVGVLIPDEYYDPDMEEATIDCALYNTVITKEANALRDVIDRCGFTKTVIQNLEKAQLIHDGGAGNDVQLEKTLAKLESL